MFVSRLHRGPNESSISYEKAVILLQFVTAVPETLMRWRLTRCAMEWEWHFSSNSADSLNTVLSVLICEEIDLISSLPARNKDGHMRPLVAYDHLYVAHT